MGQCNSVPSSDSSVAEEQVVHSGVALDVKCLPQGRTASCGEDHDVVIYNWNAGCVASRLSGHGDVVNKLAWSQSPTAARLWSCSRDLTIREWDIDGQSLRAEATNAHELSITSIGVTTDERYLFSGSRDTSVRVWDATTLQPLSHSKIARNLVTCIKCFHNEPVAAQGSEDLTLRIWDARASTSPSTVLTGYTYFPLCLDVTSDNWYAVTGSKGFEGSGCEMRVWDLRTRKLLRTTNGHQQDVTGCKVTETGHILSVCKDGAVGLWHLESAEQHLFSEAKPCMFSAVDLDADSTQSLSGGSVCVVGSTYSGTLVKMQVSTTQHPTLEVTQTVGCVAEATDD